MKPTAILLYSTLICLIFTTCNKINKTFQDTFKPIEEDVTIVENQDGSITVTESATTIITHLDSAMSTFSSTMSTSQKKVFDSAMSTIVNNLKTGQMKQTSASLYANPGKLNKIHQELRQLPHFSGKKVNVFNHITFYDYQGGHISLNIQDPDIPENIDTYTYKNDKWSLSGPVKTNKSTNLSKSIKPLEEIDFSIAHDIYLKVQEEMMKIEGGEFNGFIYLYLYDGANKPYWSTSISGSRKDYTLTFDFEGKFKQMEER